MEGAAVAMFFVIWLACSSRKIEAAKAMFVFGDSLVDSGNNNHLNSIAKSNFQPNGIDYPGKQATGRFCNGKIISDMINELMGVPPILPILDPDAKGANLLRGANFASAGAGILNDTGTIFVSRLTVPQQYDLFKQYKTSLISLIGEEAAQKLISSAIYSFTIGGNDYINNYLLLFARRARQYKPDQYNFLLISTFREQLKELYNLGARVVTVSNLGPIGCIPSQIAQKSKAGECIEDLNGYAKAFNGGLKPMLEDLNKELPGALFVYIDGYNILLDIIKNAPAYGFQKSREACCGQGKYNGILTCTAFSNVCADRTKYVFWDAFHPTESVNRIFTTRIMNGTVQDISPFNVSQLLALP